MEVAATGIKKDFIRKGRGTNIFTAVAETSLTLKGGTLSVIRGRSGSGKSTLLMMLAGLLSPSAGTVDYGGTDIYALSDDKRSDFRGKNISVIAQNKSAVGALTVEENIRLPFLLMEQGGGREDEKEEARRLMERFDIAHLAEAMPRELSGGELRRTAIARALITKPAVLFADEPTGDLDDENTQVVLTALREAADEGTAVLLVTHEAGVGEYADVRYRMDAGKLEKE